MCCIFACSLVSVEYETSVRQSPSLDNRHSQVIAATRHVRVMISQMLTPAVHAAATRIMTHLPAHCGAPKLPRSRPPISRPPAAASSGEIILTLLFSLGWPSGGRRTWKPLPSSAVYSVHREGCEGREA